MKEQETLDPITTGTPSVDVPSGRPRLRFPFLCLLIFWIVSFVVAHLNKPYFFGFLYGMASVAIVTLLFLGWWWFNRRLNGWEKCAGFALVIGEAWFVGRFSDRSVNFFSLWISGSPLIASSIVVWLFFARRLSLHWERIGFVVIVSLVWSYFLLIRLDGADSRLTIKTHWRWTPTPEDRFLAQSRSRPVGPNKPSTQSVSITASASDWVAFRGPERDGVILGTSISTNWTAHPPSLVWKHEIGPAWSSLLIVRDRLYTQEQRGEQEAVTCYDATTGGLVWIHQDAARFEESVSGPGPRATPTFAAGRLFTLGGTGLLSCLDAGTGQLIWQRDLKKDSGAKVPMWAYSSSPLVVNDVVMIYAGGELGKSLLAYRVQSGDLVWTAAGGQSSYSSPQLTIIAGLPQCLMFHDAGLSAFDIHTG